MVLLSLLVLLLSKLKPLLLLEISVVRQRMTSLPSITALFRVLSVFSAEKSLLSPSMSMCLHVVVSVRDSFSFSLPASLVSSMGKATSQKEAWDIMQFLLNLIEKTPLGDERLNCLLDCAAEIFQYCEKPQQEQFLQIMIPYLLKMAQTDVGFSVKQVVSGPDHQIDNGVERTTVETQGMGKVQLSINTTAIETISNAVRLIHNLIIDAKDMMLPFVNSIHDIVFPLVDFSFHEDVRSLCAKILPQMLELLVNSLKAGQTPVDVCVAYFNEMMPTLFDQYDAEDNASERSVLAECIRDSIQICYESGEEYHHNYTNQRMPLTGDTLSSLVTMLHQCIDESVKVLETMYKEIDFNDREMDDARNEFEEAAGEEKDCVECLMRWDM